MFLMKDEVLAFIGESEGEFVVIVPIGHASREGGRGSVKEPFEMKVTYLE